MALHTLDHKKKDESILKALQENTQTVLSFTKQLYRTEMSFDSVLHGLKKLEYQRKSADTITCSSPAARPAANPVSDTTTDEIEISIPRR